MNISDLSTTESRQLLLVHSRLHYDRMDNVANMLKLIHSKGYFQSEAGACYKDALTEYLNGKTPLDCVYCGNVLTGDATLICDDCSRELFERVNLENKEIQKERAEFKRAKKEAVKIPDELKNEIISDDEEMYAYAQNSLDELLNDANDGESAEIVKKDQDKESPVMPQKGKNSSKAFSLREFNYEHSREGGIIITIAIVVMMAVLCIMRVRFGDFSEKDFRPEAEPVSKMPAQEMLISAGDEKAAETEIATETIEAAESSAENTEEVSMEDFTDDAFMLLGANVAEADERFGESEKVVSDNSKYYPSSGISLLFNERTGVIVYIDNDGTSNGEVTAPIFGILPGDSIGSVRDDITSNGIAIVDVSGDSFMCRFSPLSDESVVYELDITYSNGTVNIVSAMLLE